MSKKRKRRDPPPPAAPTATPDSPSWKAPWKWIVLGGVLLLLLEAPWKRHASTPGLQTPGGDTNRPSPPVVIPPAPPASTWTILPATKTTRPEATEARAPLSDATPAIRIAWLGNTGARLDSCDCLLNVKLTQVAAAIRALPKGPPRTVLLDAGGSIDGQAPLDLERTKVYASALKDLGFAALAVGGGRGHLTPETLRALGSDGPPLLLAGGEALRVPLGSRSVSILCADSPPSFTPGMPGMKEPPVDHAGTAAPKWTLPDPVEQVRGPLAAARARGDLVIVVGDLSLEDATRLSTVDGAPEAILVSRFFAVEAYLGDPAQSPAVLDFRKRAGRTSIYGMAVQSIGTVRSLELSSDGTEVAYGTLVIPSSAPKDPAVDEKIQAFFDRIAADPTLRGAAVRRFGREPLENDAANGYAGFAACAACHQTQATQWRSTLHAFATKQLEMVDRHYYPGCITCHSTGYGYPSGYCTTGGNCEDLRNVGCETCHGPGRLHAAAPREPGRIRRGSSTLCLECHDGKDAQPLGDRLQEAYSIIRH